MNDRKINVKIDALGRVKVDAEGFSGASCEAATKPIEEALMNGGNMQREFKPEWMASSDTAVETQQTW